MSAGQLVAVAIGFFAFWVLVGGLIRNWLDWLASQRPGGARRAQTTRALLVARYEEWGTDFVSFLVYWAGNVAFLFLIGLAMTVTGHFGWAAFCVAGATFGGLVIAAAVKHGKGSLRNVWRLIRRA